MFGESDSESPRVPSPWDSLSPASSSPPRVPKLVPEADEGNVEYKLQLLSPTPTRFARLVTQLKWRLLEGGGQAYYELGVADSGMLVGLPRQQLEESLETLEMMAGEIGASVIVVKEIEVPPELSSFSESQLERWDGKRSARRKDLLQMNQDTSPTTSATEELSTTDIEESRCCSPATPASLELQSVLTRPPPTPNLFPFDPALTILTLDLGEDVADFADNEALDDDLQTGHPLEVSVNLEISSVYKPRPMKKPVPHITSPPLPHLEYPKKRLKNGHPPSRSTGTACHTEDLIVQQSDDGHPQPKFRIGKWEKRREPKLGTLLTHVPTRRSTDLQTDTIDYQTTPSCTTDEPDVSVPQSLQVSSVAPQTLDVSETTVANSKLPRLIVEALVVRKLSLDEAFLDFEGFSLQ